MTGAASIFEFILPLDIKPGGYPSVNHCRQADRPDPWYQTSDARPSSSGRKTLSSGRHFPTERR